MEEMEACDSEVGGDAMSLIWLAQVGGCCVEALAGTDGC